MAREQDSTAADIAYAQYLAAAEKTRTVGGRVFRLADPVTLHFPGAEPPWYAQSLVFVVHGCTADGIGAFLRAL